ncbi:hypothetical protein [Cohnella thermotolerans]|uniref:hypothetical protein n=1 Tax=Cohnella thermotolerans TaxID=329858 RepID=UPI0004055FC1|nr:hypothetical protein [Cohnella thermotolerans]
MTVPGVGFAAKSCFITTFFNNDGTVLIMTPIGSLATLLWIGLLQRDGIALSGGYI